MTPWVIRAPDHLGDGIMARPTVAALAQINPLIIVSPGWGPQVYPFENVKHTNRIGPKTPDTKAVLLKPSLACAWRYRHFESRIGIAHNHRGWLLTTALPVVSEHRIDGYARIARTLQADPEQTPSWPVSEKTERHDIILVVGTASPKTVRYHNLIPFIKSLASRWKCLAVGGPGDETILKQLSPYVATLPTSSSLNDIAAHASNSNWAILIDSGLGHLVAASRYAAGRPKSKTLVLYGSTDPTQTGPRHTTAIKPKLLDCWPCYAKSCKKGTPCLNHDLENVLERIQ